MLKLLPEDLTIKKKLPPEDLTLKKLLLRM